LEIVVVGLNHKTAPIEVRERLSVPSHRASDFLKDLEGRKIFDERVLLSTCNRTEIYGVGQDFSESIARAKHFLSQYARLDLPLFEDKLYVLRQPHSVDHLFSVASGLDSMVVGETEITGQVKDAYSLACEHRQTGKVLNHLFQRSLKVAKNVRTHTDIGLGRVSVASVAVDLAGKIFENLKNVGVMVIGTGEVSTQVLKALIGKGASATIVSSRHFDRARQLAAELGAEALSYEDYEEKIAQIDILISATSAPKTLIDQSRVRQWLKIRHQKPLFLIDLAVPRNMDTAIEKLDNVYLYNVDDLRTIADRNKIFREGQLSRCVDLIRSQRQYFMDWLLKEFGLQYA
jgi:glutamyl-tRNA reductase